MEVSDEQWGPWIEHDGKGCPCVGQYVHTIHDHKDYGPPGEVVIEVYGIAGSKGGKSWDWKSSRTHTRVIRYRIRKPRGMSILNSILSEVERDGGKGYDVDRVKEGVNA